jgi:hypothetical protein
MMMAHDSTPNRPALSPASVEALEHALQRYLADDQDTTGLRDALQRIAAEARQKKMHAEHLLMQLKEVWYKLPQIRRAPDGEKQNLMLQRIVTLCIREYYST